MDAANTLADPAARAPAHPRRILAFGGLLGVAAELFFDGVPLGLGWPLWLGLGLLAFWSCGGREAWQRARGARWLLAPLLGTAGFVAVRDSPELTVLNVAASSLCLLLFAHFATGEESPFELEPSSLLHRALAAPLRAASHLGPVAVAGARGVRLAGAAGSAARAARALAVAVPVVLVFAGLLASADAAFERVLASGAELVLPRSPWGVAAASLTAAGAAVACAAGLAFALRRGTVRVPPRPPLPPRLSFATAATTLALVSLLFASFGAVQLAVLLGDASGWLPAHLTWAQYVHRGFYQLLAVVLLTLVLLLALGRWTALESGERLTAFKALGTALVLCAAPLEATAVRRLLLYQDAYGASVQRTLAFATLCLAGAVLAWRAASLWLRPRAFAAGALALFLAGVLALDVWNPDARVAAFNLQRSRTRLTVDRAYLARLSADALPAVRADRGSLDEAAHRELLQALVESARRRDLEGVAAWNASRRAARLW